jgi:hypothetical protein
VPYPPPDRIAARLWSTIGVNVFFYGLFMDEARLASWGIVPSSTALGYVDGFALRIGERATLERRAGARAYGVLMNVAREEARALYTQEGVADYVPEPVIVRLADGTGVEAACYNLPAGQVAGANKDYAKALLEVATRVGLPDSWLDEIRRAT